MLRLFAATAVLAAPSVARAQTAVNQGGPMTVEAVTERYAIAPEVKASSFDGATRALVGGHGGVVVGSRLLIGAGFYTMVNGSHGQGLTYGGGVVGWDWWNSRTLTGSIRGLVGFGDGTATQNLTLTDHLGRSFNQARFVSSGFFVTEPQADLLVRLTKHLHLDVGAGYRFTNADHSLSDRFNGATGNVALRIGPAQ